MFFTRPAGLGAERLVIWPTGIGDPAIVSPGAEELDTWPLGAEWLVIWSTGIGVLVIIRPKGVEEPFICPLGADGLVIWSTGMGELVILTPGTEKLTIVTLGTVWNSGPQGWGSWSSCCWGRRNVLSYLTERRMNYPLYLL